MQREIIQQIKQHSTIILHRHVRPDPDAYGSQVGLAKIIEVTYPEKQVYVVGEEDPSLAYLAELDDIKDETYENALVIVCDTANEERVCDQRHRQGNYLIKIDHHPNREPYGDVMWVDPDASSTCEMIYELYETAQADGWVMTNEAARLIYAGIIADTGRFLFPNTTERTFKAAKSLIQYDFDRQSLHDNLYRVSLNTAKFKGELLSNLERRESGLVVFKLTQEMLNHYDVTPEETHAFVSVPSDIEGVLAWVFFVEEEDVIRIRLRSKGPVINGVAEQFDGGGHPMASGAKIPSWDQAEDVIDALDAVCLDYQS
ncbi:DHH family phosphoesterase [Alkalibacillus salilacus]|uniref:Phosphoesterase RecJ-like protein n=1 Tax=Alkalibacillus salilacus TaxID=284582 RepID=A0ABT9VGV3_9BACI|nr:bifunctional oligoribonuclease/PAP phosphatase NrnA [Alkalibacillus salilacus]MDQ0160181.1 phosphoesterase RecJ-like protein [Alkalibacillus salilacus]